MQYPDGYTPNPRQPNCGVLAVAMCTGKPYPVVWRYMARFFRSNWKGRTRGHDRMNALGFFGAEAQVVIGWPEGSTVAAFAAWAARRAPGTTYMVKTRKHIMTIRDGIAADQNMIAPAAIHKCYRLRVKEALYVKPRTAL
jgi:hypothetical protein